MKIEALITAPYNDEGLAELRALGVYVHYRSWKEHGRGFRPAELVDMLSESSFDCFITEHDTVDRTVIESCPSLKLIGVCRGTPSNVDVEFARSKGIKILNTPGRNAQAVAEMFIANVITFYRNTIEARRWLMDGKWAKGTHTSYLNFKGNELAGKTVGMVGFGAVGQHIARMLKAFPCKILYFDPYYTDPDPYYVSVDLNRVFSESDIVAINLPVTESTKGMIGEKWISKMKITAVLVNMSRAVVLDRSALFSALQNNKIRGAVLDVFDHEPPDDEDNQIIRHPNVLATPHIAGATHEVEDHHVEIMNALLTDWIKNLE